MIQAASLIRADNAFEPESLDFLFEERVKFHGSVVGTAPSRVTFGPLINADEDMMLKSTHESIFISFRRES